ncbi:MAG: sugar transferase [candidate division Zixibacteria bacterium]|nr:sugar transferase [candidate division Zixibacteria bacterium]
MTPETSGYSVTSSHTGHSLKYIDTPVDIGFKSSRSGPCIGPITDRKTEGRADPLGKVVDIRRGIILDNVAIPIGELTRESKRRSDPKTGLRRILLLTTGQIFASIIALAVLITCLWLANMNGSWVWGALVAMTLIRIWYFHTRGPKPVLSLYKVRKGVRRTVVDEGKIGIVFLGVCFVMSWPLMVSTALVFMICNIALQLCLMSLSRLLIKMLASYDRMVGRTDTMAQKAIIVGTGENARTVADMVLSSPELDTELVGFLDFHRQGYWRYQDIPLIGHPDILENIVANSQVDALFWALEPEDVSSSWKLMETAEKMGVRIFVMPKMYQPKVANVTPTYINGLPAMVYRSEPKRPLPLMFKTILDRVSAFLGLVLVSPIMLAVAAIVKIDSRGPIFFKQTRLGLNGKPFTLFKFRTMCSDAETRKDTLLGKNEMSGPVFKIKRDPRVTKVGRIFRKFSIDELPQLFNILKGEMSLVGPRPPLPQEVRRFEPWQHRKLSVRPGLTCLWQVNGRNNIDFEEWMRLDLQYIDNWSFWLDAKILAKTVPTVVRGSGQ